MKILTFSTSNAKLAGTSTATFSLPAGFTCPGAKDCLSRFDREKRKIVDGKNIDFRCYAASAEATWPSVARSRDRNLAYLREAGTMSAMKELILDSLPCAAWRNIRIHESGDFFSADYFRAWCEVAAAKPKVLFYAYTKNLPVWVTNKQYIPDNLVLTASVGGRWDSLIEPNRLRKAVVVMHPEEAEALGLEIDKDDSHARSKDGMDFALLIHGPQPKGSAASEAIKRLRSEEIRFSYGR